MNERMGKLSYKLLFIVIISLLISITLFYVLFVNRYSVLSFYINHNSSIKTTAEQIEDMQTEIKKNKISKKDKQSIYELMKRYKALTMTLYSENDEYITDHILMQDSLSISTNSFWIELYYPELENYRIDFYDGTCYLVVQSLQGMGFIMIYLFVITLLSIILFFGVVLHFVRKKMNYVVLLENEMKFIENGDLAHEIAYRGNDEITSLAKQLNHLRHVLKDNMEKEQEARRANEELITTMSHDLRTPLTSLLGYLDILELHIYKNMKSRDSYIHKSKEKAEQIKYMSDRLFTHFFILAQDDDVVLQNIMITNMIDALQTCKQELESEEYEVNLSCDNRSGYFLGDMNIIDRIFNNIFSNIVKYADKKHVEITLEIIDDIMVITIENYKKLLMFKEESTCIGIKSIEKMMKQLNGNVHIHETEKIFSIQIMIPFVFDNS